MRPRFLLHALILSVVALAGCGRPPASESEIGGADSGSRNAGPVPEGVIVSIAWLLAHHGDPSLCIIDAREPKAFETGHVAGAVNIPYELTYGTDEGCRTKLAPVSRINEIFGSAGVSRNRSVIVYGDKSDFRPAARVFWVLEVHGHTRCAVMNGGFPAWGAAGGAVTTMKSEPEPATFVTAFDPTRLADKLEVRRSLGVEGVAIIDSRGPREYAGEEKKGEYARAGHIPSAINRDIKKLYATAGLDSCEIKSVQSLKDLYRDLKVRKAYVYCNSGRSAAVNYLALRALGVDVAVYDGAWIDWAADERLPVTTGGSPGMPPDSGGG